MWSAHFDENADSVNHVSKSFTVGHFLWFKDKKHTNRFFICSLLRSKIYKHFFVIINLAFRALFALISIIFAPISKIITIVHYSGGQLNCALFCYCWLKLNSSHLYDFTWHNAPLICVHLCEIVPNVDFLISDIWFRETVRNVNNDIWNDYIMTYSVVGTETTDTSEVQTKKKGIFLTISRVSSLWISSRYQDWVLDFQRCFLTFFFIFSRSDKNHKLRINKIHIISSMRSNSRANLSWK